MKKILFLILVLCFAGQVRADEMYDFDLKFLDNPFAGQKIVTQKEFDAVTNKNTTRKEPSKFSKWFWGVNKKKNEVDPNAMQQFNSMPSELGSMKSIMSTKPVLTLGANITDSDGRELTSGHYQVDLKNIDGQNYIVFLQAHQTMGRFRATPCVDNYKSNQIIYSRLIEAGASTYRIIYSNLDGTHQGFARILE